MAKYTAAEKGADMPGQLPGMILTLFDGGTAAGQGEAQAAGSGNARGSGGVQAQDAGKTRGSGAPEKIIYGRQEQTDADGAGDAQEQAGEARERDGAREGRKTPEERRRAFHELINGEFKDLYTEQTQSMIDRRFRQAKELEAAHARTQPVIDMLMERYGISSGDVGELERALESDDAYWREAAEAEGMSPEQFRRFHKLQRENRRLERQARDALGRERAQRQLDDWYAQAQTVKEKYAGFDLAREAADPQFVALLRSGVPMEHAWKVMHMDEIVSDAMRTSAQQAERAVVSSVRARGARPRENGASAGSAFTVRDDVSRLTRADRAEIARRVQKGEKIVF